MGQRLARMGPNLVDQLASMWPPTLDAAFLASLGEPLLATVHIATLGTLLALGAAIPLAFLAARTTSPFAIVRLVALLVLVTSRSVNSLVWALLFVLVLGPGTLAGILAIAVRSVGFCGKLLYEAIEEVDPSPIEAIRATGASSAQTWVYAIVPQVLPALISLSVFRWEINVRESTVIGLVGAGGLGLVLKGALDHGAWRDIASLILLMLILVAVCEALAAAIRARTV